MCLLDGSSDLLKSPETTSLSADWTFRHLRMYGPKGALLAKVARKNLERTHGFWDLTKVGGGRGIEDECQMELVVVLRYVLESSLKMKVRREEQHTMRHLQIGWLQRGSAVGTERLHWKENDKAHFRYWSIH